jgi:hypothetical protein
MPTLEPTKQTENKPENVLNDMPSPEPTIKKRTEKEIAILTHKSYPWKSRIRKSTFLPMLPRPCFGNIIHIRERLSHKLKRRSYRLKQR